LKPNKEILIVEDDSFIARETKIRVENLGYNVSGILPSGEEAVEKVDIDQPDLILMDIKLKGQIDGVEAAKQIKMKYNIPIVYVTAFADKDLLERVKTTGPYGYITKPYGEAELHTAIEIAFYKQEMEAKLLQDQKLKSIGILAGGIAHDFNNILYPIIGFTQLSIDELPKTHPVQENLSDILDGAMRAKEIVKRILLFSRQTDQELNPITLGPVIEETLILLRATIPKNIEIKHDFHGVEDYVLCDATEIHEIVMNLCTNAYHAMEDEGGIININLQKSEPDPHMNLPIGEYLCLSVRDNGIGIAEELKNNIFEPYFTTKEVGKGTGLGLSLVHGIVLSYMGGISVTSSPDNGSVFNVFLPVATKVGADRVQDESPIVMRGTEKILMVDDEKAIVKLGIRIFERLGYDITGEQDSSQALDIFKSKPEDFDLVITDMAMPGMIGTQLAQAILEIRPNIPIIICSGYSKKLDDEKAKGLNIKAFIDKPIDIEELINKVREIFDQRS